MHTQEELNLNDRMNLVLKKYARIGAVQEERIKYRQALLDKFSETKDYIVRLQEEHKTTLEAIRLITLSTDKLVETTLGGITGVINRSLKVLFPEESFEVSIKPAVRNNSPNFLVKLIKNGNEASEFKHSGTGLSQIVSFLFAITLIDLRRERKIFVCDEIFSGMHPDAKEVVKKLILSLSNRFQFIIIEYGMDVGQEYELTYDPEIENTVVKKYDKNNYYTHLKVKEVSQLLNVEEDDGEEYDSENLIPQ